MAVSLLSSKGANAVKLQAILGLNSKLMVDFGQVFTEQALFFQGYYKLHFAH